jgi:iron complex transport system substrate-binding protein
VNLSGTPPTTGEGFCVLRGRRSNSTLGPIGILVASAGLLFGACTGGAGGGFTVAPSAIPAASTAALTSAVASVAPSPGLSASPTFPITLTDDARNQVVLKAEPHKIVSLTPAVTETLFAIGAGDRLVADGNFDDYPAQVKSLPHVATYSSVDVEKIAGLGTDLVIAGGNGFNKPDAIKQLQGLGVPVLVVYAPDVAGVLSDINLIGDAVGDSAAARSLTATMQTGIDTIRAATSGLPQPRTFYELDATKDIYGPAPDSFLAQEIQYAGGSPITTGDPAIFSIPLEKLIAADPQVIVLGDSAYGTTAAIVAARPGWKVMTAVKTGAIEPIDDLVVSRPGPRLVDGLRLLALAIHPDLVFLPLGSPAVSSAPSGSPVAAPSGSSRP